MTTEGRTVAFDDLPDDLRVLIYDLVTQVLDGRGHASDNGRTVPPRLPLVTLDVDDLPSVELDEHDRGPAYALAMDPDLVPPIIVSDGHVVDGRHRIHRHRETGRARIEAVDLTGIADPTMVEANSLGTYLAQGSPAP